MKTLTTTVGDIKYEEDMPMGALRRIMAAAETGNLDLMIEGYAKFVAEWPFAGDPSDAESWDDLKRSEFNAITSEIVADLATLGNL